MSSVIMMILGCFCGNCGEKQGMWHYINSAQECGLLCPCILVKGPIIRVNILVKEIAIGSVKR